MIKMAAIARGQEGSGFGVDAFVPEESQDERNWNPCCTHGPALLFERFFHDKSSRRFYACSACRDRKECQFFQWENDKISEGKKQMQQTFKNEIQEQVEKFIHSVGPRRDMLKQIKDGETVTFCHDCNLLLFQKEHAKHNQHSREEVLVNNLRHPCRILKPSENKKSKAQFLFSDQSCQFLVNLLKKLGYKKIICIGVPSLHEAIQNLVMKKKEQHMDSLLLDIDYRYAQFYDSSQFCYYNMFNHFFFDEKTGKECFKEFITKCDPSELVIVVDPPFGGLMSVLAVTLGKINKVFCESNHIVDCVDGLSTILVLPYFLESHVTEALPMLKMIDYKVAYENHSSFKQKGKSSKRGSAVRLYSNIDPKKFVLPKEEGYRFCKKCERYVAEENRHCEICKSCTSKDGRTYVHCQKCQKCVKPGMNHCEKCNGCYLPEHDCSQIKNKVGCHICGKFDHKRKECPKKNISGSLKRSVEMNEISDMKAKKRKTSKFNAKKQMKKKSKKRILMK